MTAGKLSAVSRSPPRDISTSQNIALQRLPPEHDLAKLYAIVENAYFVCTWTSGEETVDLSTRRREPSVTIGRGSRHEHGRALADGSARRGRA
jgi:hypothetical protein